MKDTKRVIDSMRNIEEKAMTRKPVAAGPDDKKAVETEAQDTTQNAAQDAAQYAAPGAAKGGAEDAAKAPRGVQDAAASAYGDAAKDTAPGGAQDAAASVYEDAAKGAAAKESAKDDAALDEPATKGDLMHLEHRIDRRIDGVEHRIDRRIDGVEGRIDGVEGSIEKLEATTRSDNARLEERIDGYAREAKRDNAHLGKTTKSDTDRLSDKIDAVGSLLAEKIVSAEERLGKQLANKIVFQTLWLIGALIGIAAVVVAIID